MFILPPIIYFCLIQASQERSELWLSLLLFFLSVEQCIKHHYMLHHISKFSIFNIGFKRDEENISLGKMSFGSKILRSNTCFSVFVFVFAKQVQGIQVSQISFDNYCSGSCHLVSPIIIPDYTSRLCEVSSAFQTLMNFMGTLFDKQQGGGMHNCEVEDETKNILAHRKGAKRKPKSRGECVAWKWTPVLTGVEEVRCWGNIVVAFNKKEFIT